MITKAILKNFTSSSKCLLSQTQRSFLTYPDKNYIVIAYPLIYRQVPENIEELIKYLDKKRPTFTLLYFTAKWNPIIKKIEKDYEKTTTKYQQFTHIRVDGDLTPMVKMYFDARVEPQFLILLNGGELKRIIGFNFDRLHRFLDETTTLHYRDFQYYGESKNQWERFYDDYDRFSRQGDYDRDATRAFMYPNNDQHRGAGTPNP